MEYVVFCLVAFYSLCTSSRMTRLGAAFLLRDSKGEIATSHFNHDTTTAKQQHAQHAHI